MVGVAAIQRGAISFAEFSPRYYAAGLCTIQHFL